MANKILVLFAHPALEKSRVNKVLIQHLSDLDGLTFHDLYQTYPNMDIDIKYEQELLLAHDLICFMHPFYWYSAPAILKEWQDLVLQHGWAYGSNGNKLANKEFLCILTTGAPQMAYATSNQERYSLDDLLAPIIQTARLCKMDFLDPFTIHGTHGITDDQILAEKERLHSYLNKKINA